MRSTAGHLLAALAISSPVAGCQTGGGSATGETSSAGQAAPGGDPAAGAAGRRLQRRFAVLRTPAEPLPPDVRAVVRAPVDGLDWGLAQRIDVSVPGSYWLLPGDGIACIVAQPGARIPGVGATCAPTPIAVEHGVATVLFPPSDAATGGRSRLVVGVAPDGARVAEIRTGATVERVPVGAGVFVLRDGSQQPPDGIAMR